VNGTSKPWLAAAVAWTAAVLIANSVSVSDPQWAPPFLGADKVTHGVMYAGIAFAWRRAFRSARDSVSWSVLLLAIVLGALDEWHQTTVPGRSAEVLDWVADAGGAALGILAWRRTTLRRNATA
jgi:hypothetical protein